MDIYLKHFYYYIYKADYKLESLHLYFPGSATEFLNNKKTIVYKGQNIALFIGKAHFQIF